MSTTLLRLIQGLMGNANQTPVGPLQAPNAGVADEMVREGEAKDAKLRRKGRASYILTGDQGAGTPTTAAKTLTGE